MQEEKRENMRRKMSLQSWDSDRISKARICLESIVKTAIDHIHFYKDSPSHRNGLIFTSIKTARMSLPVS